MDEIASSNRVRLCGIAAETPVLSHENRSERFYVLPLEVDRLSGVTDRVKVIVRQSLLPRAQSAVGRPLAVDGESEFRYFISGCAAQR